LFPGYAGWDGDCHVGGTDDVLGEEAVGWCHTGVAEIETYIGLSSDTGIASRKYVSLSLQDFSPIRRFTG